MTFSELLQLPFVIPAAVFISTLILAVIAILLVRGKYLKKIAELEKQLFSLEVQHSSEIQQLKHERDIDVSNKLSTVNALQSQKEELNKLLDRERRKSELLLQKSVKSETRESQLEKEKAFIENAKKQMATDFEVTLNRLYDQKQAQFNSSSKTTIETVIAPFRSQIQEFNKRVEDMVHKEAVQRGQLSGQIVELQKQAHQLSTEANNLAGALKGDNKTQGSWGELILEKILEQSGLERGREYQTQKSYEGEGGKKFRPDVIVHLPDGKDIVIDSKVSLVAYEKYSSAVNNEEREQALNAHVESLRAHIKGLSLKNYESLSGIRSLDFVFLFIPIEAAYLAAIQGNSELFKEAYDRSIVLVSPSSLMVAVKTIETLWRHEKQNSNVEKIASSAGRLYDQFVLMVESFDDIGQALGRTQDAYDKGRKRLAEGRGNLIHRVEQLKVLGAKTSKTLPDKYQQELSAVNQDDAGLPDSLGAAVDTVFLNEKT